MLICCVRIATVVVPVCFVAGWIASSERDGMIRRDLDEEARHVFSCVTHAQLHALRTKKITRLELIVQ
jgi:hypothetical protein